MAQGTDVTELPDAPGTGTLASNVLVPVKLPGTPRGKLHKAPVSRLPGNGNGGTAAGGFALRSVSVGTGGEHVIALPTTAPRDVARYGFRLLTGGPVTPPTPGGPIKVFKVGSPGNRTGSVGIYMPTSGANLRAASSGPDQLVKLLAGNEAFTATGRDFGWDKTDRDGNVLSNEQADACYAKARLHSITARQLNVLGNTSNVMVGPSVWSNAHQWRDLACSPTHGYPAVGATEGTGSAYLSFLLSDPNTRIKEHQQDNHQTMFVAVDQQGVWRAGQFIFYDKPTDTNYFWEFVTYMRFDGTDVQFEAGMPLGHYKKGPVYEESGDYPYSAICRSMTSAPGTEKNAVDTGHITGLVAQQTGPYALVFRRLRNEVAVLDKASGATLRTWSINQPRRAVLASDNVLWVIHSEGIVEKFALGDDGVGTATGITLAGLVGPVALGMVNGDLAVVQGDERHDPTTTATHGFKGFDATTGAQKWSEINGESYDANVRVLPKKYFTTNTKSFTDTKSTDAEPYICGQPDGKFWFGDIGNYRNPRFLPNRELDPSLPKGVSYIGYHYSAGNDGARPTRIFFNYCELEYDLDANTWELVANYSTRWQGDYDDPYNRLTSVYTYESGMRCVLLQRQFPRDNALMKLVAMTASGLWFSERLLPFRSRLDDNGDLVYLQAVLPDGTPRESVGEVGSITQKVRCAFTGTYDQDGLPIFGEPVVEDASPVVQVNDPVTNGGFNPSRMVTSNGTSIFFSSDTKTSPSDDARGGGPHIGGKVPGADSYLLLGIPTTHRNYQGPYPTNNTTNGGRGVVNGLSTCLVSRNVIITQYYGEFDDGAQANKIHLTHEDFLPLNVAGVQGGSSDPLGDSPEFLTSNTSAMFALWRGSNTLLTGQNDEGFSGGIMLIAFEGFDTIEETTYDLVDGEPVVLPGVALLPDVPFDTRIRSGQFGFTFTPDNDALQLLTSRYTYGDGHDAIALWRPLIVSGSTAGLWPIATMPSNPSQTSWLLEDGAMRWLMQAFNDQGQNAWLEQLDEAGKVIWQLGRKQNSTTDLPLLFNEQVVGTRSFKQWRQFEKNGAALRVKGTASSLTLSYGAFGPFTVDGPFEAGANILRPRLLRARFDTPAGGKEFGLGFTAGNGAGSLRFISNPAL